MAQYRLRDAGSGRYVVSRKRFGLFWVDYDTSSRPTYLIEKDMNSLHKKAEALKEKHEVATRELKTTVKNLIETDEFKATGVSLQWTGGFWPPFRKKMLKPPTDWKSLFPNKEPTYDEHLYPGDGSEPFTKMTVFSSTDLNEENPNVVYNRAHRKDNNNQQGQRKKGSQQQRQQRGPEFDMKK